MGGGSEVMIVPDYSYPRYEFSKIFVLSVLGGEGKSFLERLYHEEGINNLWKSYWGYNCPSTIILPVRRRARIQLIHRDRKFAAVFGNRPHERGFSLRQRVDFNSPRRRHNNDSRRFKPFSPKQFFHPPSTRPCTAVYPRSRGKRFRPPPPPPSPPQNSEPYHASLCTRALF